MGADEWERAGSGVWADAEEQGEGLRGGALGVSPRPRLQRERQLLPPGDG